MSGQNQDGGSISSGKSRLLAAALLLVLLLVFVALLILVLRERKKTIVLAKLTAAIATSQQPLQKQVPVTTAPAESLAQENEAATSENPAESEVTPPEEATGHRHAKHHAPGAGAMPSIVLEAGREQPALPHRQARHEAPEAQAMLPATPEAGGWQPTVPVARVTPAVAETSKAPVAGTRQGVAPGAPGGEETTKTAATAGEHLGVPIVPVAPAVVETTKPVTAGAGQGAASTSGVPQPLLTGECTGDSVAPWVYPDPAAGLYYGKLKISFQTNKPCTLLWRSGADTGWATWTGDSIALAGKITISYKAIDKCGRTMEPRFATYVIKPARKTAPCPEGMEPVETGSQQFCIDRFEWPDRKGVVPRSYVSIYQAMDSCATRGKRLCSADEWSTACAGADSSTYPYGRKYERYACVTHDTTARRSGSRPSCRSYFGTYDMAGNLAEWTSTPSNKNPRFFEVMGGMWASGPASGCYDIRYSYYPQNRHNPVGFRCCKEIVEQGK